LPIFVARGGPFNAYYPNGVEELISKNSNGWRYTLLSNGLGQSHIGIKGIKPIASNWSFIFNLQTGFDPYSLQLANGPKSLAQNNTNERQRRFQSRRPNLQHGRLRRREQSGFRNADGGPARLAMV